MSGGEGDGRTPSRPRMYTFLLQTANPYILQYVGSSALFHSYRRWTIPEYGEEIKSLALGRFMSNVLAESASTI